LSLGARNGLKGVEHAWLLEISGLDFGEIKVAITN